MFVARGAIGLQFQQYSILLLMPLPLMLLCRLRRYLPVLVGTWATAFAASLVRF